MADLIYRGSPPVGALETQELLAGPFNAIWSPPRYRRAPLTSGDRVWLLWQAANGNAHLLGSGLIRFTDEGQAAWTNRSAPGIVDAARRLGYGGPSNMAFLRLADVRIAPTRPVVANLDGISKGLTFAAPQHVRLLLKQLRDEAAVRSLNP